MDSQLVVSAALAWRGFDETIESVTVLPDANARSIRQDKVIYIEHRHRMLGSVLLQYASWAREANSRGLGPSFYGHLQSADGFDSNLRRCGSSAQAAFGAVLYLLGTKISCSEA